MKTYKLAADPVNSVWAVDAFEQNTKNLRPFNLEAALKGEQVMLRNGSKAFVRHHETELTVEEDIRLVGFTTDGMRRAWCVDGNYFALSRVSGYDIIGMYPKTRIINGFEVPAPETEEPEGGVYFLASTINKCLYRQISWDNDGIDRMWLKRGLIFLNKKDAIANAKAMLGINPYEESE